MHRKRHALGQNFLTDTRVIDAIVEYTLEQLKRHPIECLLEIGPGKGALTFPLVEKLPSDLFFSCMEVDADLVDRLINKRPSLKVYHQDARHVPDIFLKQKMGVVSNLPYASGVHILLKWSQNPCLLFFVVMLQKEVAQKF